MLELCLITIFCLTSVTGVACGIHYYRLYSRVDRELRNYTAKVKSAEEDSGKYFVITENLKAALEHYKRSLEENQSLCAELQTKLEACSVIEKKHLSDKIGLQSKLHSYDADYQILKQSEESLKKHNTWLKAELEKERVRAEQEYNRRLDAENALNELIEAGYGEVNE